MPKMLVKFMGNLYYCFTLDRYYTLDRYKMGDFTSFPNKIFGYYCTTPPNMAKKCFFLKSAFIGVFGVEKHESAISFLIWSFCTKICHLSPRKCQLFKILFFMIKHAILGFSGSQNQNPIFNLSNNAYVNL